MLKEQFEWGEEPEVKLKNKAFQPTSLPPASFPASS